MKTVFIKAPHLPIKLWLDDIEEGAMEQAEKLAMLPFAHHHIAIMPDSHQGFGMPIGGVMATKGVVVPNAVGVDIGCGMCAVKTSLMDLPVPALKAIMGRIREEVPVGFKHHDKKQDMQLMPFGDKEDMFEGIRKDVYPICSEEFKSALKQLGTLGGGNHFIEIQKGSDGFIWIMIHSGSRNLGKKVADHYNKLAEELNAKWHSAVPKSWELAFLPLDSEEGQSYMREMNYCVEFALANRKLMMDRICGIFDDVGNGLKDMGVEHSGIHFDPMINIAHNYAIMEHHFGSDVLVHRKGATLAREGTIGIIPGSQGTKSYIVKGKGNTDSFMSCSHGAGRKMSRTKAINELDLATEQKLLDDQGIIHAIRDKQDLDEAPGSYKDISVVMANQADLVDILVELTPLGVIKG
jgi:tRNA-splicing ligase RtcB